VQVDRHARSGEAIPPGAAGQAQGPPTGFRGFSRPHLPCLAWLPAALSPSNVPEGKSRVLMHTNAGEVGAMVYFENSALERALLHCCTGAREQH